MPAKEHPSRGDQQVVSLLSAGTAARSSVDRSVGNTGSKLILKEIRSIKTLIKPTKKTVRVIKPALIQNSLTKAVRHACSNEVKFTLIEWIQKNHNKQASDEIAKEIGLNEAKQIRKRLPVDHSRDRKPEKPAPIAPAPEKEIKKQEKKQPKPEKIEDELQRANKTPQKPTQPTSKTPTKPKELVVPEPEPKRETPKETPKEAQKEAPREAPKELGKEPAKEVPKDPVAAQTTADNTKKAPKGKKK